MQKLILILLTVITTMNTHAHNAYNPPVFLDKDRLKKINLALPEIEKMYENYAHKNHFPGYAFGIMVDGQLIYSGAKGQLNTTTKQLATDQSMFRIASMSKSFTAMAIVILRDEGKLKLDDLVSIYIPEIKNQALTQDTPELTIRDLLTHSSGLPKDDPWGDRHLDITNEQMLAILNNGLSFAYPSGTHYEYNNLTYGLLGLIIERVSGKPYQEYIKARIWEPLNMQQASWEFTKVPPKELAQGYRWANKRWQEEELLHDGAFGAMGGMIASIKAFSLYVGMHQMAWPPRNDLDNGPIKRSSLREMQKAWNFVELNPKYKFVNGSKCAMTSAYGYGLKWMRDCKGRTFVGHSGGLPGFGSNWFIMPDYGIGVILFANGTYAPTTDINLQVLTSLIEKAKLQPREIPLSPMLKNREAALIKMLPDWKGAERSDVFSDNFFLDFSIAERKKQSMALFQKIGNIVKINKMIADNQLKGSIIINGEKASLKVVVALNPLNPALIQTVAIEKMK